ADRNRSHWSTSKTPSYTKSVSWQHHHLYLYKDESLVSKHYINYMAIPENDGVFTWLPDFFPHVAVDISIYTNVEDDYFFLIFP
ncbi:hypothetical protein, partial [Escherichia coli]|uniref:hypothetical protein n=1 Tax=Escherichia coli TaxID=562 RepID=UPI00233FE6C1